MPLTRRLVKPLVMAVLLGLVVAASLPAGAQAAPRKPVKVRGAVIGAKGLAVGLKCTKRRGRCKGRLLVKDRSGGTVARKRFRLRARRQGVISARLTKPGRQLAKKRKLAGAAQGGGPIRLNVVIYTDDHLFVEGHVPFGASGQTIFQSNALRCLKKGEWAAVGPEYAAYETYNFVPVIGGFTGIYHPRRRVAIITSPTGQVSARALTRLEVNQNNLSELGVLQKAPGLDEILAKRNDTFRGFGGGFEAQTAGIWTYQVVWEFRFNFQVDVRFVSNRCTWEATTVGPQAPSGSGDTGLVASCPTATLGYGQQASGKFELRSGTTPLAGKPVQLQYLRNDVLQDVGNPTTGADGSISFGFTPSTAGNWKVVATFEGDAGAGYNRATATCSFDYQDNRLQPYFGLDQTCPHNAGITPQNVNLGFQLRNDIVAMSGLNVTATWFTPAGDFHSQQALVSDADGSFNTTATLNGPGNWTVDLFYAGDNSNKSAAYSCTVSVAPHPP